MSGDPFLAEVRQRDANKGHSPAGITMTQAEWDRRYLLGLLDRDRAALLAELEAGVEELRVADRSWLAPSELFAAVLDLIRKAKP